MLIEDVLFLGVLCVYIDEVYSCKNKPEKVGEKVVVDPLLTAVVIAISMKLYMARIF